MLSRIKLAGALLGVWALVSACTVLKPNYQNPVATDNAKVRFVSVFELHTHFYVNTTIDPPSCGKYKRAGYVLRRSPILSFDKANPAIHIEVPSNQVVGFLGRYQSSDGRRHSQCFPQPVFFTPEPHGEYWVDMNARPQGGRTLCFLSITEIKPDGKRQPIASEKPSHCNADIGLVQYDND